MKKYKPIRIVPKNEADWLKLKAGTIGSSEATIACGISQWKSPYELFLEKTGKKQPDGVNDSMILGKLLERPLAEFWAIKTGHRPFKGTFRDIVYKHPDYDFISCTPDVFFRHESTGQKWLLEVKNPDNRRVEEPEDSWVIQLNWQLGILGMKHGALLWSYPQRGVYFKYVEIDFNQDLFDSVLSGVIEFWTEYVQKNIEPPLSRASDVTHKFPTEEPGKTIEASESIAGKWAFMKEMQGVISTNSKILEGHKEEVKLLMEDAESIKMHDQTLFSWKANKNGTRRFRMLD
jgi:predicted phage-related endonuclease